MCTRVVIYFQLANRTLNMRNLHTETDLKAYHYTIWTILEMYAPSSSIVNSAASLL